MPEDIKQQIENLVAAFGALGEAMGILKKSLLTNGFDEEETLYLCGEALSSLINPNK